MVDVLKKLEESWLTKAEITDELQERPIKIISLDKVKSLYQEMKDAFPSATIYAGVKANHNQDVLRILNQAGSNFEIASGEELKLLAGATLCKVISVKPHHHDRDKAIITLNAGQYNAGITRGSLTKMIVYRKREQSLEHAVFEKLDDTVARQADIYGMGSSTGDMVRKDTWMPANIKKGDVVAIMGTGAYTSAFANRLCLLPRVREITY